MCDSSFNLASQPVAWAGWLATHGPVGKGKGGVTSTRSDLDQVDVNEILVTEREVWQEGPPHKVFKRLRQGVPDPLDLEA